MAEILQMSDIPATGPHDSAYPDLWDGLVFCSSPSRSGPTGLTLRDWSGYGNHGVLTNMSASTDWVMSKRGWVLDYDGLNDFVDLGAIPFINSTQAFSFSAWIKLGSLPSSSYPGLASLISDKSDRWVIFFTDSASYRDISFGSQTTFARRTSGNISIVVDIWYNIVITYNGQGAGIGTNWRLYFDGIELALSTSGNFAVSSGNSRIGFQQATGWLGQIGPVSIYNRALDANEIMDMYLGAHPLTPIRGVVLKAAVSLLLRQSNMDGGMENLSGGFA